MTEAQAESATRPATRVARVLTEVFAPAVMAAVMPIVVGVHAGTPPARGLLWGVAAAVFSAVIPFGIILIGVRRGRLTDHHVGVRQQRLVPLVLGLSSVVIGLLLLALLGAPRELLAMVAVMLLVLAGTTVVNHFWKLSAHAAVGAGSVAMLVLLFGPWMLVAGLVVVLVGWSRVQLRDHTPTQVVVGAALGAVLATATFLLLR